MSKPIVMALVNQKGGTGKTQSTENLGIGLAAEGKKVLLVDEVEEIMALLKRFVPEGMKLDYADDLFDVIRELNIKPQKSQLQINYLT